jgi:hypothetical protein
VGAAVGATSWSEANSVASLAVEEDVRRTRGEPTTVSGAVSGAVSNVAAWPGRTPVPRPASGFAPAPGVGPGPCAPTLPARSVTALLTPGTARDGGRGRARRRDRELLAAGERVAPLLRRGGDRAELRQPGVGGRLAQLRRGVAVGGRHRGVRHRDRERRVVAGAGGGEPAVEEARA